MANFRPSPLKLIQLKLNNVKSYSRASIGFPLNGNSISPIDESKEITILATLCKGLRNAVEIR